MENRAEQHDHHLLRELAFRVASLEDNVAFLEVWCEEQQDVLDRVHDVPWWFFDEEDDDEIREPARLYVVDLRDNAEGSETEHQRRVRQIRARLDSLRHGMADRDDAEVPGGTP